MRSRRDRRVSTNKRNNATSTPTSTRRNRFTKHRRQPLSFQKAMFLGVLLAALLYGACVPLRHFLLGNRTMRGGELGRMLDTLGRTLLFRHTLRKRTRRLAELGILQLPPMKDSINKKGIPNLPQAALVELLVRSKIRAQQLREAEKRVIQNRNGEGCDGIPKWILQPDHGDFFRPVYADDSDEFQVIHWDLSSMRQLIQQRFPALLRKFDRTLNKTGQTLIWSLCALYWYGGYVLGRNLRRTDSNQVQSITEHFKGCDSVSVAIFECSASNATELSLLATTPRHAFLKHVLDSLADSDAEELTESRLLELLYVGQGATQPSTGQWDVLTCLSSHRTLSTDDDCDRIERTEAVNKLDGGIQQAPGQLSRMYIQVASPSLDASRHGSPGVSMGSSVVVTISEGKDTLPPSKVPKVSIQERLNKLGCEAGWICNRCLKNAAFGTHESCRFVCRSCYEKTICSGSDQIPKKNITMDVSIREGRPLRGESRIPRIIHQTWFEEPTVDRYPQLARLQNSWKNTGWEYRFYTDATMRKYIVNNFPDRFVDAFDAFLPGAFKADFFRYLVLLKDGGVYADVDILLDTNLDSFITPSMSFFVPRDIVGDYVGENFCLWNGLMGAAPGHPFLVRAVELLLTIILNRVDYHDMEREMCRASGSAGEVWKMRALTILSLSGPCLLGHAVNLAIGNSNLISKYEPGWLIPNAWNQTRYVDDIGDALILIASRADMGALRFSDVDRNLLVASTGMTELSKDRILTMEEAGVQSVVEPSHTHYSEFENVNDVFGAESIYIDSMVNNEDVTLKVSRVKN